MSAQMSRAEMRDEYWADALEVDEEAADADRAYELLEQTLAIARRHGWSEAALLIQRAAEELPGED